MTTHCSPHPHVRSPIVPERDHGDRLILLALLVLALPACSLAAMLALV